MTLQEVYNYGTDTLKKAGIENPSVDAFYLLEFASGCDRAKYLMFKDQQVNQINFNQYDALIKKRAERIPYQYITGRANFAGLNFEVNQNVLIPRLDTEVLFENTLKVLGPESYVLDLCTGSGCIGISLKRYRPDVRVVISDISEEALKIAEHNIHHNHIDVAEYDEGEPSNLTFGYDLKFGIRMIKSDLFEEMEAENKDAGAEFTGLFDVIVSNPPYVTEDEYEVLMPEVKNHEPKLALTAGKDGLDIYRRIISGINPDGTKCKSAKDFLKEEGTLIMEIGCSQAEAVKDLMISNGFKDVTVKKDMAGLYRVVAGKL